MHLDLQDQKPSRSQNLASQATGLASKNGSILDFYSWVVCGILMDMDKMYYTLFT